MTITVRHTEPGDYEAIQRIYTNLQVIWGTLQLPMPSVELWRKRLAEPPEGMFSLVACVDNDEVVGQLGLHTSPNGRVDATWAGLAWPCAMIGRVKESAPRSCKPRLTWPTTG